MLSSRSSSNFRGTLILFVVAALLLATGGAFAQTLSPRPAGPVQVAPRPVPVPIAVTLPKGDDAWMTPPDGGTVIDFINDPLPSGFFNTGSLAFSTSIALKGVPIATTPPGALGVADTLVRRLDNVNNLGVNQTKTTTIEFIALSLESISSFRVDYSGGGFELWKLNAGLSPNVGQTIGTMSIKRTQANGGNYTSTLFGQFLLTFTRVSPSPAITRTLDCGLGECEEMVFASNSESWTLVGGPANWQPGDLQIDPLPSGVNVDINGDGIPDNIFTIGRSNFQVGVKFNPNGGGGGGGGGGEGECDGTDHINGQSKIETHTSFLAGDSDADGKPNDCDDCTDADGDGVDDLSGETCGDDECEPTEDGDGPISEACAEPVEGEPVQGEPISG